MLLFLKKTLRNVATPLPLHLPRELGKVATDSYQVCACHVVVTPVAGSDCLGMSAAIESDAIPLVCGLSGSLDGTAVFDMQQDDRPGATMPAQGTCPACGKVSSWLDALKNAGNIGWKRSGRGRQALSVLTAAYSTPNLQGC